MPAEIRLHPDAERELRAAFLWYFDRNILVAEAFRSESIHAVNTVAESPQRWPLIANQVHRYVFPRFLFSMIYRGNNELVATIAIAHQKRRPGYRTER